MNPEHIDIKNHSAGMTRVSCREEQEALARILAGRGFSPERAGDCAGLFADTDLDGVYSHGLNRFPRFLEYIEKGWVKPSASPTLVHAQSGIERWDGGLGPGNLNARDAMNRSIELSGQFGMGCVALANTNHWMRGGAFGWQAARAGRIGIAWTNTTPNLPPWGAKDCFLGNNPLVIAVPGAGESHIVLDMAMSQYSYGKMEQYLKKGEKLPYEGGFDRAGNLSLDPEEILSTRRPLAVGYWKGTGLSLMLDLMGLLLSGGQSVPAIGGLGAEYGLTQVFITFAPGLLPGADSLHAEVLGIIAGLKSLEPAHSGGSVDYPGERSLRTRVENQRLGIPLDAEVWASIKKMST